MTDPTDEPVRTVTRRQAMQGTGVALGSYIASGRLTDAVLAQSGGPSDEISGTVEDSGGPVQGATVVAVPHDETLAALETTTDANGDYIFAESDLHTGSNLYHVIARDGTETDPRRGVPNYPFIAAEGPSAIPASGISRYEFEQDVTDSWGDNDGTDNTSAGYATGQVGTYAKEFDGVDDGVSLPAIPKLDPGSILGWVKYEDTAGGTGSDQHFISLYQNNFTSIKVDTGGALEFTIYNGATSHILVGPTPTVGQWYHVAGTINGTDAYFYVDGTQEDSVTGANTSPDSGGNGDAFGRHPTTSDEYFFGDLDHIEFHDKELTQTEVQNHMNTGSIDG